MKKLNIGCQQTKLKGFINLDINPLVEPDIVANALNMPFDDSYFDNIWSYHCIEHIRDFEGFMRETWRVLKPNCFMDLSLPFGQGRLVWVFDHVISLQAHDFYRFEKNNKHKILNPDFTWEVVGVHYNHDYPIYLFPLWFVGTIVEFLLNTVGNYDRRFRESYECHWGWLFPMASFRITLKKFDISPKEVGK